MTTLFDAAALRRGPFRSNGLLSELECAELWLWAKRMGPCRALEVGHYHGLSTAVLLMGLEEGSSLVTIDHHQGDLDVGGSDVDVFERNIAPYKNGRVSFESIYQPYEQVDLEGPYDFVFYDAMHSDQACSEFVDRIKDLVTDRAVIGYDDADWERMKLMTTRLDGAGFRDVTRLPIQRFDDKNHRQCYTIRFMSKAEYL